jgi:uncharacterized protein
MMHKILFVPFLFFLNLVSSAQTNSTKSNTGYDPFSQDAIIKDGIYPGIKSIKVISGNSHLKVLQYYPTGKGPHPTLILLHGYTGMPGNVDIATTLSRAGWNVIFFRYRGIWGMPGEFSFLNCVEDAVNIVNHFKANAGSLNVDTTQIALFGHSMGGWVALKAATRLPSVKKIFALSTWDIYKTAMDAKIKGRIDNWYTEAEGYSELKITSGKLLYEPVLRDSAAFALPNDGPKMAGKRIFFLDEHNDNKYIVDSFKKYTQSVEYDVWKSDHSFTYTRVAMMRMLLSFLNR